MNVKPFKVVGIILAFVTISFQFVGMSFNQGELYSPYHVSKTVHTSDTIESILQKSCYDCHSDYTIYPWYSNIQPIGYWLNQHIEEGKAELNFSIFGTYKKKKQLHKLDECIEMIEENQMPLVSYTLIHQKAKLTLEEKLLLIRWAKESKNYLNALKAE